MVNYSSLIRLLHLVVAVVTLISQEPEGIGMPLQTVTPMLRVYLVQEAG